MAKVEFGGQLFATKPSLSFSFSVIIVIKSPLAF
jgi:hypothetical protein